MNQDRKIIGIIPARGGSKGIPKKNIKYLAGKPLIAYTIEAALKAKKLDRVIVSTDDEEIAEVARKYGAEVPFLRPKGLSKDTTPMYPVIRHALYFFEKRGEKFKIIIILQPTSPLRRTRDIVRAINKLIKTDADSVVSVCLTEHSPYWMRVIRNDRVYSLIKSKEYLRRQDLPKVYRLNGAIYVTKRDILINQCKILGNDTRALLMSQEDSIDIDNELDFNLAEIILRKRK